MIGIIIYTIIAILVYIAFKKLDEDSGVKNSGVNPYELIATIFWPLTVVAVIVVLLMVDTN